MTMADTRRYEIASTLGEGGFGTVYLARMLGGGGFSKPVALKVLRTDVASSEEVASRLRDEARILGLIRHRAVVHVDGLIRLAGRWTVVMEYVDGVDLRVIPKNHGPMPLGPTLDVVAEVAGALHVAYHTTGPEGRPLKLLHRDIKPGNIKVTPAGEVKVLDFGVARADFEGREAETQHVRFGSTGYLAPERLTGRETPAADVYSLGVVMHELLTAKRFGQCAPNSWKQVQQLDEKIEQLRELVPNEEVHALFRDMLAWDPEARPTARDVERRAATIRASLPRIGHGEILRDWAERELPQISKRLAAKAPQKEGDLTGRSLVEEGTNEIPLPAPVPATSAPRSQSPEAILAPPRGGAPARGAAPASAAAPGVERTDTGRSPRLPVLNAPDPNASTILQIPRGDSSAPPSPVPSAPPASGGGSVLLAMGGLVAGGLVAIGLGVLVLVALLGALTQM